MERKFGWRKDPYNKKAWVHPLIPRTLPDVVDLSKWLPIEIRDQQAGDCVGMTLSTYLAWWAKKLGVYSGLFSPTWIYNGARFREGTLRYDDGCYPDDALKWLVEKDGLLEKFWPYSGFESKSPPSSLEPESAKWPVLVFYRITDGVDGIMDAMAQNYAVAIGTPWYDEWMNIGKDGKLPELSSSSQIVGGHETLLHTYDRIKKLFGGRNSWGTAWADSGNYWMPFSAFTQFKYDGGYDAHYFKVEWVSISPNSGWCKSKFSRWL